MSKIQSRIKEYLDEIEPNSPDPDKASGSVCR